MMCHARGLPRAQVYCVHTEPNYSLPWQRKRQATSTSSGFMVMFGGKRRLLTNAHSVDYYTQVSSQRGAGAPSPRCRHSSCTLEPPCHA